MYVHRPEAEIFKELLHNKLRSLELRFCLGVMCSNIELGGLT